MKVLTLLYALHTLSPCIAYIGVQNRGFRKESKRVTLVQPLKATTSLRLPRRFQLRSDVFGTIGSIALLGAIDEGARLALAGSGLPHSLVAGSVLAILLTMTRNFGESIHEKCLAPGSKILLKWMAVFFAPNLITLPLAKPIASGLIEWTKLSCVVIFGLFVTMATSALVAAAFDTVDKKKTKENTSAGDPTGAYLQSIHELKGNSPLSSGTNRNFGKPLLLPLILTSFISFVVFSCTAAPLAATSLSVSCTLAAYAISCRLSDRLNNFANRFPTQKISKPFRFVTRATSTLVAKTAHPVILTSLLVTAILYLTGAFLGFSNIAATELYAATGGPFLTRMLGPCVIGLACGVYARRRDIARAWLPVSTAVGTGAITGLYGTALAVNFLQLPLQAKLSLLPRCVTSPLALPILSTLKVDPGAALAIISVTGILGAALGPVFLSAIGIGAKKSRARGLAMGAAAHGVGTAQMASEPYAQPYASIAMALTAALSVALALTPPTQRLLLAAAGVPSI